MHGAPSKKNAPKITAEEALEKGREAFLNYDFETAEDFYSQYRKLMDKAKKPYTEELELLEDQLNIAVNSFDRVEKIVVIDSISLPRDRFYKEYKLSSSSGNILKGVEFDKKLGVSEDAVGYVSESGDYVVWADFDENDRLRIKDGFKTLDGEWTVHDVELGGDDLSDFSYPFMLSDGQTLYFASNGENSMGGYDIFVAQRDPISGKYRQPLNLGMPFNSPYDDMMMAIDEENGIGWWATDRHSEDENIDVYVYIINNIRHNYPSDFENLDTYARLDNYKLTQSEESENEINRLLNAIDNNNEEIGVKPKEFVLPMGKGKVYYNFSDFNNKNASEVMRQLIEKKAELEKMQNQLDSLRKRYNGKERALSSNILEAEKNVKTLSETVEKLKNEVYRLEKESKK